MRLGQRGRWQVPDQSDEYPKPAPEDGTIAIPPYLYEIAKRRVAAIDVAKRQHQDNIFKACLDDWRDGGNPISAFEALANWNRSEPLPGDLASFFAESAASYIDEIRKFTTFSESNWTIEAGTSALVRAFGLNSDGKKGGNPFARYRDQSLCHKAAEAYLENCTSFPAMKSEEIVNFMAKEALVSTAQMRRYIKGGLDALGVEFQKEDIRTAIASLKSPPGK